MSNTFLYQPLITCPYCSHKIENSFDYNRDENDYLECEECEETFEFVVEIEVSYSTYPVENKNLQGGEG